MRVKKLKFTHIDEQGRACMVDVGDKIVERRQAVAQGKISLAPQTCKLIRTHKIPKGEVLNVARVAGIQAAKHTPYLIPLCHTLPLDHVGVTLRVLADAVLAESTVSCIGRTGVEMEALTAVSVALLTVYDMCKALDKTMRIHDIYLLSKVKQDVNQK